MSTEPTEQWQAGYEAALEREPARLYLDGPGAAQLARLLTAEAAIARLTDLCDESRSIVRTAEIRAVLDAVSVDATPTRGIDRDALEATLLRNGPTTWDELDARVMADHVLSLVRPVEGVLLSREEAARAAWALRNAKGWPEGLSNITDWAMEGRALAARLEASA